MIPSGVAMELLLDAMEQVESAGNVNAVSSVGAKGPYQLMDKTGREYHRRLGIEAPYNPFSRAQSRMIARAIISDYVAIFNGDPAKGILAYHSGPGNVKWGTIGPHGRAYVGKVLKAMFILINERHGDARLA